MRSAPLASILCGLALVSAPGCVNEAPVPAYVSAEYQVRCQDSCFNTPDSPARQLFAVDGEQDLNVTCRVGNAGGQEVLTFSIECAGGDAACGDTRYGIEVTGVQVRNGDGDPGGSCQVSIREGSNVYESGCTGGALTSRNRCQMDFSVDTDGSEVTGTLRCVDIPNASSPTSTRSVVTPGTAKSFEFIAQGCEGL